MKTIHDENLDVARYWLRSYEEQHPSKLFKGVHLRYFTKIELIKIIDLGFDKLIEMKGGE